MHLFFQFNINCRHCMHALTSSIASIAFLHLLHFWTWLQIKKGANTLKNQITQDLAHRVQDQCWLLHNWEAQCCHVFLVCFVWLLVTLSLLEIQLQHSRHFPFSLSNHHHRDSAWNWLAFSSFPFSLHFLLMPFQVDPKLGASQQSLTLSIRHSTSPLRSKLLFFGD